MFWLFVLCLSIYLLTMGGHLYSADTEIKAMITESLVTRHSVALPSVLMMYMVPGRGGLSYSSFPIGTSLTMIPFYLLGNGIAQVVPSVPRDLVLEFCLSLINELVTALTCVLVFVLCRRFRYAPRTALATTLVYGFCTIAWPYAKTCWSEPQAALCVLAGFYCAVRFSEHRELRWAALSGAALGYGTTTKHEMGLFVIVTTGLLLVYLRRRPDSTWRQFAWTGFAYGLPLALFGLLNLYYNYLRFDRWWTFSHYGAMQENLVQTVGSLDPLKGIIVGLYQHLFSTGKSILLFSPPLILFYWAMKGFKQRHPTEAGFILAVPIVFFVSAGMLWEMSRIAWGERYLVTLTPFLVLPLSALFDDLIEQRSVYLRKTAIVLAASGLCIQVIGLSVNFQTTVDKLLARGEPLDIQTVSYDPEYSPILLNLREVVSNLSGTWQLLTNGVDQMANAQPSSTLTTADFDQKAYREVIRYHTFDFWFLYMYFAKFPVALTAVPFLLLVGSILLSGRNVYRLCWQSVAGRAPSWAPEKERASCTS